MCVVRLFLCRISFIVTKAQWAFRLFIIVWTLEHEWPCCRSVFLRTRGHWLSEKRIISPTLCTTQKTISCSTSEGRGHMLHYGNNARRKKGPLVSKAMCVATLQKRWEDAPSSRVIRSCYSRPVLSDCGFLLPKKFSALQVFSDWNPLIKDQFSSQFNSEKCSCVCGGEGSSSQIQEP